MDQSWRGGFLRVFSRDHTLLSWKEARQSRMECLMRYLYIVQLAQDRLNENFMHRKSFLAAENRQVAVIWI
jgi:hypothetical protein